jgi:hypothetical protein
MKKLLKNRYGSEYSLTLDVEGNILWEGDFSYSSISYPIDYSEAYKVYYDLEGNPPHDRTLSLKQFKIAIHEYCSELKQMNPLALKYSSKVKHLKDEIQHLDPPGGPYICREMKLDDFGFPNFVVKDLKRILTGYKIIKL